jgi:hypothetical protein
MLPLKPGSFPFTGKCDKPVKAVKVNFTGAGSEKAKICICDGPPNWTIFFRNVPEGEYKFELLNASDSSVLASMDKIQVGGKKEEKRGISMTDPPSGATRDATSVPAWGTTDEARPVEGRLLQFGGMAIQGTVLQQPMIPDVRDWLIRFDDVTPGSGYVLVVLNSGGSSDRSDQLTIT